MAMRIIKLSPAEKKEYEKYRSGCVQGGANHYLSLVECRERRTEVLAKVLRRDALWGLLGVYRPDVDGVIKWFRTATPTGRIMVTMYGSQKGKIDVDLSDDVAVADLASLVEQSFYSGVEELNGAFAVNEEKVFTLSSSLWIDLDGMKVVTRVVIDVDDLGVDANSFSELLRNVSLAATSVYAHMETVYGLKPLRHVVVYFSGSKGIHIEVIVPVSAMWVPSCNRDGRLNLALGEVVKGALPRSSTDSVQAMNMVARVPFTANVSTGLPKVPLGEDGKPIDYMPHVEPVPDRFASVLMSTAMSIPSTTVCNTVTRSIRIGKRTSQLGGRGTIKLWSALIEAIESGSAPKFTDCRRRLAYSIGKWCRYAGMDEEACIAIFAKIAEEGEKYRTEIRLGYRFGESMLPPNPHKVFCENAQWYSCPELQKEYCELVQALSKSLPGE